MQTLRRITLTTVAVLSLAGSVGLAAAAPLPGSSAPAVTSIGTQGAQIDKVWWHRHYWHRHYWHRHYWHRHW